MDLVIDKYKAIIFDLFHTLTSVESTRAPGRGTSEILGISREKWNDQLLLYSKDRLRGKITDPFKIISQMARAVAPDISDRIIDKAIDNRIRRFRHTLVNIPKTTIDTLEELKSRGKKLGLVSNADATEKYGWNDSPLKKYFDCVVFSCDVGYIKPEKEIYELCIERMGVLPRESMFVGDGGSDELKGAKALGIKTVLTTHVIKSIWPEKIKLAREFADFEIDELHKLFDI